MQSRLLTDEMRTQIAELFSTELVNPVALLYFSSPAQCDTCDDTHQLLEEVVELSDLLSLSMHDIELDAQLASDYHVELAPGLVIAGLEQGKLIDYGIRFLGIPSGYEFSSLIHSLVLVSKHDSGLSPQVRAELKQVITPITLKVFVTPTCSYCPQAVLLAHQMAMENQFIQSEMIEANEFYDLAIQYNVSGVPQTNINEGSGVIVGAVPAQYLLQEILTVIST